MATPAAPTRPQPLPHRPPRPRRVALAFPVSLAHLSLLTHGVTDFAREHARWLLTTSAEQATLSIESLRGWKGEGVIATITSAAERTAAIALQKRGIHVVNISSALRRPGVPSVRVDNHITGNLAAEHLLACGFRNFAFYGLKDVAYSDDRGAAFIRRVRAAGWACSSRLSPHTFGQHPWQDEVPTLVNWIRRLQLPVGIFAVNDYRARLLGDACQRHQLKIPQEVGIIGADNNQVVCEYSEPNLTSIRCDWHALGHHAAEMLDALMCKKRPAPADIFVPPRGIQRRASTHITLVHNPHLARAIAYIQEHIGNPFGVEKLIDAAGISRRALEFLFSQQLHCTPHRYLCMKRVERASELLHATPDIKLSHIARRCGFPDPRRFRIVFRRIAGVTPAQFRKSRPAPASDVVS